MYGLFSGRGHPEAATLQALEEARLQHDVSQVPVIVELLRFLGSQLLWDEAMETLIQLTGQDFGPGTNVWGKWSEWLGSNLADYQPPEGYVRWKIDFLKIIDPRFEELLAPAEETARVDPTELVWGGVPVDGIPDLQDPPAITPEEANYLAFDERVFGVSINGEHRAYPLRILNRHEMANDVLGGEPISLAY